MEKARNGSIDEDDFRQLSGTNSDDVAVAASLLKMYFRELQTGVVCAPVLNSILVATGGGVWYMVDLVCDSFVFALMAAAFMTLYDSDQLIPVPDNESTQAFRRLFGL